MTDLCLPDCQARFFMFGLDLSTISRRTLNVFGIMRLAKML